ncbi:MAG: alpha/beta hydrolase [Anaerolineae bacterium]
MGQSYIIQTEDGRELSITEAGRPNGVPVLVHHGTPGSRLLYAPWVKDARSRGIRLISYDRPGYGGSTPQPGRTVADAAADVAAIASELGVSRLLVWGISGGGPHALACAALLPDLVVAAAALASVAPYPAEGLDWFAGMAEANVAEFRAAINARDALQSFVAEAAAGTVNAEPATLAQAWGSLLSPVDAAILAGHLAAFLLGQFQEGLKPGIDGWVDDDVAFTTPWEFEGSEIRLPVLLMHGEHDRLVPFSHGRWLADRIPNVDARLSDDDGHLTLIGRIPAVHAWLLDRWH